MIAVIAFGCVASDRILTAGSDSGTKRERGHSAGRGVAAARRVGVGLGIAKMRTKQITEESIIPETVEVETEDLFEMANLYPDTTGLPMTVWVSPRGNARHDVRVKVNMTHGNQMNIDNTAVVSVRPTPRVIAGQLSPADAQAVFQWISLNAGALVEYWEGRFDTAQLIQSLRPLSAQPPTTP